MDLRIKKDKCVNYSNDQKDSFLEVSILFLRYTVWNILPSVGVVDGPGVGVGVGVVVRGNPAMEIRQCYLITDNIWI